MAISGQFTATASQHAHQKHNLTVKRHRPDLGYTREPLNPIVYSFRRQRKSMAGPGDISESHN
jgi:hypothetical protein